jgi:hypothetical protein
MAERVRDLLLEGHELPKETVASRRIQRQRDRAKTLAGQQRAEKKKPSE